MSKATHTPGPWHVGTDGNVHTGETHGVLVAEVSHNSNGVSSRSSKPANARLIAAAPCLLAALRALADKVDATSSCDHKRATCEEVGCVGVEVRAARAAVAKAEGGATQPEPPPHDPLRLHGGGYTTAGNTEGI